MPDLDLIKQGEQEGRDGRGRFPKGMSGNPAGRPRGCRDHVNRAARLLLAGGGEALTRKAVELALAGDPAALRLCLERIVGPYRERAVEFMIPPIRAAADLAGAMAAVADSAAEGAVTPREAMQLGHVIARSRQPSSSGAYARWRRPMPRPLNTRLERREGRRTAAAAEQGAAAIHRRHIWRAEAAIGMVIRSAPASMRRRPPACVSPTKPPRLSFRSPDTPELERIDSDSPAAVVARDRGPADAFTAKILALRPGFTDTPPDFAKASFAELFAWSLAQPPAE